MYIPLASKVSASVALKEIFGRRMKSFLSIDQIAVTSGTSLSWKNEVVMFAMILFEV